jgi:multidrug efflux system membrane fusion protein
MRGVPYAPFWPRRRLRPMASVTPQTPAPKRRSVLRRWIILLLCVGAVIYFGGDYVVAYTDDAYVRSDFVPIAPEVDGIVQSVAVTDNQLVKTGDPLLLLDPESYRLTLALRQDQVAAALADVEEKTAAAAVVVSQIESAGAALQLAQQQYDRVKALVADQASPQEQLDHMTEALRDAQDRLAGARTLAGVAVRRVDTAKTTVEIAKAEQAIAAYALSRTEIKAPVEGYVTNLTVRPGVYAKVGSPMIGIVDLSQFRVIANFKEYVAASLEPGTAVWIWFNGDPWRIFPGRVASVARGVARNDTPDRLLPYVTPTTNWIRLSRRLPVTIVFDPPLPLGDLYMGTDARVLIFR